MARSRQSRGRTGSGGGGRTGGVVLGFVAGAAVAAGGVYLYEHTAGRRAEVAGVVGGTRSGAEADVPATAAAERRQGTGVPRVTAPAAPGGGGENGAAGVPGVPGTGAGGQPPFGASEEVFEAGARVYGAQCASCHGRPGRPAVAESGELAAGQFWTAKGGEAVARQPVGVIFREIAEGRPERQMPAYRRVLRETEMWDVALLLKNAGGELPEPVVGMLRAGR